VLSGTSDDGLMQASAVELHVVDIELGERRAPVGPLDAETLAAIIEYGATDAPSRVERLSQPAHGAGLEIQDPDPRPVLPTQDVPRDRVEGDASAARVHRRSQRKWMLRPKEDPPLARRGAECDEARGPLIDLFEQKQASH
jgi:hypothetical protein